MQQSNRTWCIKILAITLILLFVLNFIAMRFHLFYVLPWLDTVLHFVGGFALGVLSLIVSAAWEGRYHSGHILLSIVLVTLLGAIAWEAIEFNLDRFTGLGLQESVLDTILDIIAAFVGAFAAYGALRPRLRREISQ